MNKEIKLGKIPLITKTDYKGVITFSNSEFQKISGLSSEDCLGQSHNIIRHDDMPRIIFKRLWNAIKDNKEFSLILKSRTKDGDYYWSSAKITVTLDHSQFPAEFTATRYPIAKSVKKELEELYTTLSEIERDGMDAEIYLETYLNGKGLSFEEYMLKLIAVKDGFLSKFKS